MLRSQIFTRCLYLWGALGWLSIGDLSIGQADPAGSQVLFAYDSRKPAAAGIEAPTKQARQTDAIEATQSAVEHPPSKAESIAVERLTERELFTDTPHYSDPQGQTAGGSEPVQDSAREARHLAPPMRPLTSLGEPSEQHDLSLPELFKLPQIKSLATAGTGLALVLGLFLVCVALVKRGNGKANGLLPPEAVCTLGRIPLTPKHTAHLLQVGSKLVLVAISTDGIEKITEVSEPGEVDRLLGICMKSNRHSTSAEFQRMLQELAKEPTRGFVGPDMSPFTRSTG